MPPKSQAARREYAKRYYLANRDRLLKRAAAWRAGWTEEQRQRQAASARRASARYKAKDRGRAAFMAIASRYGLSRQKFDEMVRAQFGRCAICGKTDPRLVVDHDHETGRVRGLLCVNCNQGIGQLGDDIARLQLAIEYLREGANDAAKEQTTRQMGASRMPWEFDWQGAMR